MSSSASAAGKIKFATSIKLAPTFYLPVLAAEEKGFWKENGPEAELVKFKGGAKLYQGIVAGLDSTSLEISALFCLKG